MEFQKLKKNIIKQPLIPSINSNQKLSSNIDNPNKSPECIAPSAFDNEQRQQSAKVGIFNLISTMIGGGVLSLPYAISRSGLVLGFILLTISAIASVFSFDILVSSSRRSGAMTYQQIGYCAFGKKISIFITFLIWALTYLASIAYCVLVGDLIKPIICYITDISDNDCASEWLRRAVITGGILCVTPFCYMRQIKALKWTSMISIASVTILAAIITGITLTAFNEGHDIYFIDDHGSSIMYNMNTNINLLPTTIDDVIYVFPVFGISFLCHFNIPQVHSELTRPTRKRMRTILVSVVLSCYILYSTVAFFGYFYSFEYTCGNILLNYNQKSALVSLGRLCLGLVILFTFPLLILPARGSLHNLLNLCFQFKSMNLENYDNILDDISDRDDLSRSVSSEYNSHKRSYAIERHSSDTDIDDHDGIDYINPLPLSQSNPLKMNINSKSKDINILNEITPYVSYNRLNPDEFSNNFRKVKLIKDKKQKYKIQVMSVKSPNKSVVNKSNEISRSISTSNSSSNLNQQQAALSYNTFNSNTLSVSNKLKNTKIKPINQNNKYNIKSSSHSLIEYLKNKLINDDNDNKIDIETSRGSKGSARSNSPRYNNFSTKSYSHIDSPLRGPQDALGIVNEPSDMFLLKNESFTQRFQNFDESINYNPTNIWLIFETTIMICLSLLVAYLTESVMIVWSIAGSTVSFVIAFTLPGCFYFKIRRHKGWTLRNISAVTIAVLSIFGIGFCTWQSLIRLNVKPCPDQPSIKSL